MRHAAGKDVQLRSGNLRREVFRVQLNGNVLIGFSRYDLHGDGNRVKAGGGKGRTEPGRHREDCPNAGVAKGFP